MKNSYWILIILGLALVSVSCKRPQATNSQLSIQVPTVQQLNSKSSKNTALNSFPTTGNLCFAVNVTGDGIPTQTEACTPELGVRSNFVGAGQVISVSVPSGQNRNIEVYLYLAETGQSCPNIDLPQSVNSLDKSKLFLVGAVEEVPLVKDEESVSIDIAFPGPANSIAANFGGSCGGPPPVTPGVVKPIERISSGGGVLQGSTYKIKASLGEAAASSVMTGSNYKIKVK